MLLITPIPVPCQLYQNDRAFFVVVFHDLSSQTLFERQEILHNSIFRHPCFATTHRTFGSVLTMLNAYAANQIEIKKAKSSQKGIGTPDEIPHFQRPCL